MIPLAAPSLDEDDFQAVRAVLESGRLVQGEKVVEFERKIAEIAGTNFAIAVSNCTSALHLALMALDVRAGDICIVTGYSWISTANAIELCGAQPVFVDIEPDTFNISTKQLEKTLLRLMENKATASRVKAIVPVHTFGQMADMGAISALSARWNIPIIEDAACALGATWSGKPAGGIGSMGCFSFHPRKSITTGEGGAITTNNADIARKLQALRNHGLDPQSSTPDFIMAGHNYRMTEFQAALGCSQLKKLSRITNARQLAASRYNALLRETRICPPYVDQQASHVYQSYVCLLPDDLASNRADIIKCARTEGIELQIGTINMQRTSYFKSRYGSHSDKITVTDSIASRSLTLPLYEHISPADQQKVVNFLTNFQSPIK
jgi:perosamine synthetase